MKKKFLTLVCCMFWLFLSATPAIDWKLFNVDSDIAAYMQEEVSNRLSNINDKQIIINMKQNGDNLTIDFVINPDNETGKETSDNIWDDLDYIIQRLTNTIKSKITPIAQSARTISHSAQEPQYSQQRPIQTQPSTSMQTSKDKKLDIKLAYAIMNGLLDKVDVSYFTLSDVQAGRASIGGCITFEDGTKGVIFYLDNDRHGLAVSIDATLAKWENVNKSRECHDVYMLPNEEGQKTCTYGVGAQNTAIIINQLGIYNAPAAAWCASHGDGWYLPSAGELWYLLTVANAQSGAKGLISSSLMNVGGTPLDKKWYWSSTENASDEAINVSIGGSMSSENKVDALAVRAIRAF